MKIRRIDFSPDEWLAGTLELTPYDRGIYITICSLIYSRGEAVEIELIHRHCGVHRRALNAALSRLFEAGKIALKDSQIVQIRCLEELKIANLRLQKWAQNLSSSNKTNDVESPSGPVPSGPPPIAPVTRITTKNKNRYIKLDSDSLPREAARPSAAEIVEVDRLIAETLQAVKSRSTIPHVGKRDQWLNNLAGFVAEQFTGDARMEAWQAIEDARSAGTREATPSHTRRALDDIDKLMRTATAYAEAAE
jgi:hypothetical protein